MQNCKKRKTDEAGPHRSSKNSLRRKNYFLVTRNVETVSPAVSVTR